MDAQVLEFLNKIYNTLPSGTNELALGLIMELFFRVIPSKKPLGWMHVLGVVFYKLGSIFTRMGEISDKVLPQTIKSDQTLKVEQKD